MIVKGRSINAAILIVTYAVYLFTAQYEQAGMISLMKYGLCMLGMLHSVILIHGRQTVMNNELKKILCICGAFAVITGIKSVIAGLFLTRGVLELIFMVVPIFYAWCLINTMTFEEVDKCVFVILLMSLFAYFTTLHMGISEFISSLFKTNFAESYSPLESSTYAGISIALAMYYLYFRKNRAGLWLSMFFVFLTFKRISLLLALFMLIIPYFIDCHKEVSLGMERFIKIFFVLFSAFYFWLLLPKTVLWLSSAFNIDLLKFTMGRTYRFEWCLYGMGFENSGLGSVYTFMNTHYGINLEMDINRLIFEVTPLGVLLFINNSFDIVKKNWYCTFIMIYEFFNLIMSHSLASMFSWLLIYLTIGAILYKDQDGQLPWPVRIRVTGI